MEIANLEDKLKYYRLNMQLDPESDWHHHIHEIQVGITRLTSRLQYLQNEKQEIEQAKNEEALKQKQGMQEMVP